MKGFINTALATVPAALIAGGLLLGAVAPASAQTAEEWCNPVMGWGSNNIPWRTASGGYAIHAGSFKCPTTAAAATAAAVKPNAEYLVFFDWNKADITPAAQRTLQDAVKAFGGPAARIHVVGHTDSSGSPDYNQRLSIRRAEAVKRSIVALGVPAGSVTTEGRGESQLLVQTGPNVREPSNRRAQVLNRGASAPSS